MGSFLGNLTGTSNSYQAATAPIAQQDFSSGLAQSAGQFNDVFNSQSGLAQQLQNSANGFGPNPAQIQLQQATNQNIAQNAGMLASQRGLSPALAQRLAAQNAASTNQQAAGQGALMGAQQQIAARGQLAGVLGQQQQGALGMNQNLQNAQAQQNQAIVGNTSSMNSANSAVSMGNQQNNAGLVGGLMGGLSGGLFAHGGTVGALPQKPMHFAGGGTAWNYNPYAGSFGGGQQKQQDGKPQSGIGQYLMGMFSPDGSPEQTDEEAQQGYSMANDMLGNSSLGVDPSVIKGMSGFNKEVMAPEGGLAGLASFMAANGGKVPDCVPRMAGGGLFGGLLGGGGGGGDDEKQSGPMGMLSKLGPLAMLALNKGGDPAGTVPGKAEVAGNSLKNDKIPAMLSPKEIVLPRSITMHPDAPALAAEFVRRELHKHQADSKKNFDEGGVVDSIQKWMSPDFHKAEEQKKNGSQLPPPMFPPDMKHYDEGGQVPPGLNANAPVSGLAPVNTGFDPGQEFVPTPKNNYADAYEQTYQQLRKMNPGEPEEFSRASALTMAEGMKKADEMSQNWKQERATTSQQQAHDQAVAENTRRQSLGLSPVPIPQAPIQMQQQVNQGAPNPVLNQIPDMNAMGGGQQGVNPMAQMDQSMMGAYMKAANEQKAGFQQAAQAQDVLGKENARIAQEQQRRDQGLMNDFQQQNNQLMGEYDAAMKDYKEGHINPNHYAESQSSVGKVKTAIGLILGGMAGGLLKQENPAMKFLNAQIDRDIDAQKAELGKKANMLTANFHKFGNLRDATEMTRAMMMGIQANQFREAAANAQGPMARATALQEAGKLDERIAPIMSQISMRQTMMRGMQTGQVDPAMAIRFMAPEGQQAGLMKDLQEAQNMSKVKDNVLSAFDQVAHINTAQNRLANPIQSGKQVDAIIEPVIAQLSKETAGRFTEQDAQMLRPLLKASVFADDKTRAIQRARINKLISEKMNFPSLVPYGFNPSQGSRYDAHGMDRLPPMAPPKR